MIRINTLRFGYSIIEVVLVISAVSIVLGLCAGLIHVLLRLEKGERTHLGETGTIARLAQQFRKDVHAATRATLDPIDERGGARLDVATPTDRTIDYRAGERSIVRTQHHGDEVERRETFSLPSCPEPRFLKSEGGGGVWLILSLPRGAGPETGPKGLRHNFRIEALMGRDHHGSPSTENTR